MAKAERRATILDAALARYEHEPLSEITMAEVARDVGLVKGTLYNYFRSKEELFLALLERLLGDWFDGIDHALSVARGRIAGVRLATLFAESLEAQLILRRLLADQGTLIERNVLYENALRFKWRLIARMTATGDVLERRTIFLRKGDGVRLLIQLHALLIGLQQQADPAPVMRRILEAPGMEPLRIEFVPEFRKALRALLVGLERTN